MQMTVHSTAVQTPSKDARLARTSRQTWTSIVIFCDRLFVAAAAARRIQQRLQREGAYCCWVLVFGHCAVVKVPVCRPRQVARDKPNILRQSVMRRVGYYRGAGNEQVLGTL